MRNKFMLVFAAMFLLAISVSAQDAGSPDSILFNLAQAPAAGSSTVIFEVWTYADNNMNTVQTGFAWNTTNATLRIDSVTPSAELDAMEIGPFFFQDDNIDSTNANQRALVSGTAIFTVYPGNATTNRNLATFYMTMLNWGATSSLTIDTSDYSAASQYIFIPATGSPYSPVFGGPISYSGTAVEESITDLLPTTFKLEQNYPNPFNPSTDIWFDLPKKSHATVKVYNLLGQEVVTLVDEDLPAGRHLTKWDGRSESGSSVASGVYFYKLVADDFVDTKKMMLLK